jgi:lysophospholipase L1-like esterase
MGAMRLLVSALAAAGLLAALVTGCSAPAGGLASTGHRAPPPATYYLALGDSLSQGVQPDAAGVSEPTQDGYANQLYATLHRSQPGLRLVKLGCPGETTGTMIHGGICRYQGGSQLAAAVSFLRAHRGHVSLITLTSGPTTRTPASSNRRWPSWPAAWPASSRRPAGT